MGSSRIFRRETPSWTRLQPTEPVANLPRTRPPGPADLLSWSLSRLWRPAVTMGDDLPPSHSDPACLSLTTEDSAVALRQLDTTLNRQLRGMCACRLSQAFTPSWLGGDPQFQPSVRALIGGGILPTQIRWKGRLNPEEPRYCAAQRLMKARTDIQDAV